MTDIDTEREEAPDASDDAYQGRDLSSLIGRAPVPETDDETKGEKPAASETKPEAETADAAKAEPEAAKDAPPASTDEPTNWQAARQALKSVTDKNKALERQVEELTRKVTAPRPEPEKRPEVPDPIVDPTGFQQHLADERFRERTELTREIMIDSVGEEKFAAAEAAFIQAARADPELAAQLRQAPNPARFAYQQGTKLLESRADPVRDRAKLEEEITAKVMAKLGLSPDGTPLGPKPAAAGAAAKTVSPTSLADSRSVAGPAAGPAWDGPKPLSSLIGPRRN